MNIYIAKLNLYTDNNNEIQTSFQMTESVDGFEEGEDKYYSKTSGWTMKTISKSIDIREMYGSYIVEQGFKNKLSKAEQAELQDEMTTALITHIENQKKLSMYEYDKRIDKLKCDL